MFWKRRRTHNDVVRAVLSNLAKEAEKGLRVLRQEEPALPAPAMLKVKGYGIGVYELRDHGSVRGIVVWSQHQAALRLLWASYGRQYPVTGIETGYFGDTPHEGYQFVLTLG